MSTCMYSTCMYAVYACNIPVCIYTQYTVQLDFYLRDVHVFFLHVNTVVGPTSEHKSQFCDH